VINDARVLRQNDKTNKSVCKEAKTGHFV